MSILRAMFFAYFIFFVTVSLAQELDFSDKNESPFFIIENEGSSAEDFPLLATKVLAIILGPVADVIVEQTYKNDGQVPIEATYVFPASTRAAVYEMLMIIGDRTIKAEIQEKNQAMKNYREAKESGKRASLLTQERANVFKMQVANIMPGDVVQVVMRYNEFIIPENQTYSFVYPAVVGPRYVGDQHLGRDQQFVANPYLKEGQLSSSTFQISLDIAMAIPIQHVSCNTHRMQIDFEDKTQVTARLQAEEIHGGNRDFIFNYQYSGKEISSGTILYEHADEKFFLTRMEPPENPSAEKLLPREYIFVIDVSGSMMGFPISTTKTLMKDLISSMSEHDLFNVLLFAGDNKVLSDFSLNASKDNLAKAFNIIDQLQGSGGTELLPALRRVMTMPKHCAELSRSIVIVTDGYVSVEPEVFNLISSSLSDANVFTFGIGSGVNRLLIEGMAHVGRGEAFIVTNPAFASVAAKKFCQYIDRPVLSNIKVEFEDLDAYDIVPASIPDLMAERPIYIFGKYRGDAVGSVSISGTQSDGDFHKTMKIDSTQIDSDHRALRNLWAREKIRWHHDFNQLASDPGRVEEITNLGLKYHLLTDYTSFVAIDETQIVNADGLVTVVKQPLPLPEGVSTYAVGFDMGAEGISVAHTSVPKIAFKPFVLEDLGGNRRLLLEGFLVEAMKNWEDDVSKTFYGKKLKVQLDQECQQVLVTINGERVSERHLNCIKEVIARLPHGFVESVTFHIQFLQCDVAVIDECGS